MKKLLYVLGFVALVLSSCEEVIDFPLDESDIDLYVIDAKITTRDNIKVYITKSITVYDTNTNPAVSGAMVSISDDATPANVLYLTESADSAGLYSVPEGESYPGVIDRTYTLTVQIDDETFTATEKLPEVSKLDSLVIKPSLRGDKAFLAIYINTQEPEGESPDYYKWNFYVDGVFYDEPFDLFITDDSEVDGNYISNLEIFTDYHDVDDTTQRVLTFNSEIYVEQVSITELAYEYYIALYNQYYSGGLFSVPPSNAASNFTTTGNKKVLGLFQASDISVSETIKIDSTLENQLNKSAGIF